MIYFWSKVFCLGNDGKRINISIKIKINKLLAVQTHPPAPDICVLGFRIRT